MFVRLLVLFLGIGTIQFDNVYSTLVGGWQESGEGSLQTKMLKLARQQLNTTSESIQVLRFDTQIVSGTNLRLMFIFNEQKNCTLQAFKPLPYKANQSIQITSFKCDDIV